MMAGHRRRRIQSLKRTHALNEGKNPPNGGCSFSIAHTLTQSFLSDYSPLLTTLAPPLRLRTPYICSPHLPISISNT